MNELETGKIAAKKAGDAIKKYYKAKYEIKERVIGILLQRLILRLIGSLKMF